MTRPFRFEPEARADLLGAIRWYEQQQPGLGAELKDAIFATLENLRRFPGMGRPLPYLSQDEAIRHALVRRFPFAVIYTEHAGVLWIAAIAHTSRRPGYWKAR